MEKRVFTPSPNGRSKMAVVLLFATSLVCHCGLVCGFGMHRPLYLLPTSTTQLHSSTSKARPLSRPERKAAEREKKRQRQQQPKNKPSRNQRRLKNLHERNAQLAMIPDETPYDLHNKKLPRLCAETSTAQDVVRAIKRAQNYHDDHDLRNIARFLLDEVDDGFAYGYRGSLLARLAVAALHTEQHAIARLAIDTRRTAHRSSMLPLESAAILRGLLRVHNVSDALEVLDDELSLPLEGTSFETPEHKEKIKQRCLAIASFVSRHFFEQQPHRAIDGCRMLTEMGPIVRQAKLTNQHLDMPWLKLIQGAAQCESIRRAEDNRTNRKKAAAASSTTDNNNHDEQQDSSELPVNLVYAVLRAMNTFPSNNNDLVYEALSNALVRRTCFVTGAVDMKGMPTPDRGEAVFIGRSNVGKSSLVNMVTNRKSLAYTSKRPGKTQQFNFFAVNDKPDLERQIRFGDDVPGRPDRDAFYIVDLPGFGFARVPQRQRQTWSDLTTAYLTHRGSSLRVLFHLIDARHGPIDEDVRTMTKVGQSLPPHVKYVVVLTKADKNVKGAGSSSSSNQGKVSKDVMNALQDTMKKCRVSKAPIIITSANTKLGRDDMWRYLKLAAES